MASYLCVWNSCSDKSLSKHACCQTHFQRSMWDEGKCRPGMLTRSIEEKLKILIIKRHYKFCFCKNHSTPPTIQRKGFCPLNKHDSLWRESFQLNRHWFSNLFALLVIRNSCTGARWITFKQITPSLADQSEGFQRKKLKHPFYGRMWPDRL